MKKRIAVVGLACETEAGFEHAAGLYRATVSALRTNYIVVDTHIVITQASDALRAADVLRQCESYDALIVCVATWSNDHYILQLIQQLRCFVLLHAFPSLDSGSLCATQQIASVLTDIHYPYYAGICAEPGSPDALEAIRLALEQAGRPTDLRPHANITIGSIGGRVQGMTEIAYDEFALLEKCDAVVIPISESELELCRRQVTASQIAGVRAELLRRPYHILSSEKAIDESLAYYLALKQLICQYRLNGLAVKCYTHYMGKVCLAYSLLCDEGIVCSCEGDVNNAVMMRLLCDMTGECVNHTDFLYPDTETNSVLFSHCGSSGFSIAADPCTVELAPVRLMDCGVCSRFLPKPGLVTLADLVGHGEQLRMSVLTGHAIPCGMEFAGNPARVQFAAPVQLICQEILERGCGHHWMIGYGDVRGQLAEYCLQRGIIFQEIGI